MPRKKQVNKRTNKKAVKVKVKSIKNKSVKSKKIVTKRKTKRVSRNNTPKDKELFYMGISNPIEVRRNVLESARDMVQFLQMFERFRIIREEKKQAGIFLKRHVNELNLLTNKLKKILPKTSVRTRPKEEEMQKIEEPKKIEVTKEAPFMKTELPDIDADDIEALENELKDIEDKLNFL